MEAHTLRLPGTQPIAPRDWLQRDTAFAAQMVERDRLILERPEVVLGMTEGAAPAAEKALETTLAHLDGARGYRREGGAMLRPGGVRIPLDGPPLAVAGRLVQEDLCLMEKAAGEDEHRLTAAVLCFPSNWTLAQKLGTTLTRIHLPVVQYDAGVAKRVQRLFDAARPEAPMMRANLTPMPNASCTARGASSTAAGRPRCGMFGWSGRPSCACRSRGPWSFRSTSTRRRWLRSRGRRRRGSPRGGRHGLRGR